jgi:hypothetical protein
MSVSWHFWHFWNSGEAHMKRCRFVFGFETEVVFEDEEVVERRVRFHTKSITLVLPYSKYSCKHRAISNSTRYCRSYTCLCSLFFETKREKGGGGRTHGSCEWKLWRTATHMKSFFLSFGYEQ